ncbi:MAG TPA: hypothetical protein DEA96_16285 [Leptospiraceae bacterium]|nr:hypothetical protein [Spirochaetaceae bacterium]HBS06528.1 hypothetical protein [Leptospiraceae bacterium]|tara:strand:- start:14511 stop:15692 length:1182 start_codon:yes stop_codon:yes gene_type:complete
MSARVQKKIEDYRKDRSLQQDFLQQCRTVPVEAVLWPEKYSSHFPADYMIKRGKKEFPYPLLETEDRIKVLQGLFHHWAGADADSPEHPLVLCYYLNEYQKQFRPRQKKKGSALQRATRTVLNEKKGKNVSAAELKRREKEKEKEKHYKKLQTLKNKLPVDKTFKKAESSEIQWAIFLALRDLVRDRGELLEGAHEVPAERVRDVKTSDNDLKKRLEEVLEESDDLRAQLKRETTRADLLEEEVQRLAEQIISSPTTIVTRGDASEMESLKQEYNLLSQKYDALVSKNIDLANRLNRVDQAVRLEQVLDNIRDRVNSIIRSGVLKEEILLSRIGSEVEQLQRARIYLGRALFDMGMLYLRMGKKEAAFQELRAARELGVEDPEADRFLQSVRS